MLIQLYPNIPSCRWYRATQATKGLDKRPHGKVSCRQCSKGAPSPRQGFKPTFRITTSTFFQPDQADTRRLSWKRVSYVSSTPVSTPYRRTEEAS